MGKKKFLIKVNDMIFGNFEGMFIADTEDDAIDQALEFYAHEFDTFKKEVNVLEVKEVA